MNDNKYIKIQFSNYIHFCKHGQESPNKALFIYLVGSIYDWNSDVPWILSSLERRNFHWMEPSRYCVLSHVWSFLLELEHGVLAGITYSLNRLVSENKHLIYRCVDGQAISQGKKALLHKMHRKIVEEIDSSVLQEFHKVLTIPKLHLHLSDILKVPDKANESLLCFINFVIELLYRVAYRAEGQEISLGVDEKQMYALLRKELIILSTFLEDTPYQFTHEVPQVNIFLAEIEKIVVELGRLVYSCLFEKLTLALFNHRIDVMAESIKTIIEHQLFKLSEFPRCEIAPKTNPIDAVYIVGSLLEDLERLMSHGFDFSSDAVVDLVNTLKDELELCRLLLKNLTVLMDSGMNEITDSVIKVRDFAYEAEYIINSYVAENIPIWYINLRLPSVICKIKFTRTRLQECSKTYANSKFIQNIYIKTSSDVVADNLVVGFQDNRTKILADLTRGDSKNLRVVSIVGMPGLGKTTIAKKLYHDPSIYNHFDRRGWCVVSQTYDKKRVLIEILTSITGIPVNGDRDCEDLGLEIHKSLIGRRFLIVIDDIWESSAWNDVRIYFPDNGKCSRVLLTSRIKNSVPIGAVVHSLPLLSEIQAWELLENKVFSRETCPPQLIDVGKELAANCRGLPLAIVVTAGILTNVERGINAWGKVKKQLDVHMLDDLDGYRKILELSYENLPNHLKLCFLHMGMFPEDSEIQVHSLIRMWIGEGFVERIEERNQEDVAEEYLVELINRNLLTITKRRSIGGIKSCIIHDLLRDMCIRRAEEEKFMKSISGDNSSTLVTSKRLSFPSSSKNWRYPSQHCRAFVGNDSKTTSCFLQKPLLRTVSSQLVDNRVLKRESLEVLGILRYLSLRGCGQMPTFRHHNFASLEFFDIEDMPVVEIPPVLLKMVKLRYLRMKGAGLFADDCDSSITNNLEYLSTIVIQENKDVEILKCSPHLRRIKCQFPTNSIFPAFSFFTELESLTIISSNKLESGYVMQDYSVRESYDKFTELNFSSTITKLHLARVCLSSEKMSIIGGLPNLKVLKLNEHDFVGDEWSMKEDEFLNLRFLKLKYVTIKQWNTSSCHFPELECLVLVACFKFEEIYSDFGDHVTLQTIEVDDCSKKTNEFAALIEKEQHENGNEEFKAIISDYFDPSEFEALFRSRDADALVISNMVLSNNESIWKKMLGCVCQIFGCFENLEA